MPKSRSYSTIEKNQILAEVVSTGNIATVSRKNDVPASTIHTWLKSSKKKDKLSSKSKSEFKSLQNQCNDLELENKILKELLKKTYQVWDTD